MASMTGRRSHLARVDVLLLNPPSPDGFIYIRDVNRHGRSSWERIVWPQTSLAYLASMAESCGLTVDIVDCIAERLDWAAYERIVRACRPRYCVSNVISATYSNDIRALRAAKEASGAVTIGLGPHLTNSPLESLCESPGLDFIITHEPELTLKELLEVLEKRSEVTVDRLRRIEGIAFVPARLVPGADDAPEVTPQRAFAESIDCLPRPRHDLLPLDRYWAPFLGNYTFVEASRGCTFRCVFCRQAVMWQWKYRGRSGHKLAEEALYVHSLGVDNILFHADTFTLDPAMVEELCDELIARGSPFRWACNSHVRPLLRKRELVRKMRRAGCWMMALGIESGDNEVLKGIRKMITVEDAEQVVQMVHEEGIEVWGYFVLGLPGDTRETIARTTALALRLPLSMAKFDIAAPYPGTEFYRYAKERGYLRAVRHEDYDQNASAVVDYPQLSAEEIRAAVRSATRRFFLRPRLLLRLLREVKTPGTLASLLRIARDQVRLLYGVRQRRGPAARGAGEGA